MPWRRSLAHVASTSAPAAEGMVLLLSFCTYHTEAPPPSSRLCTQFEKSFQHTLESSPGTQDSDPTAWPACTYLIMVAWLQMACCATACGHADGTRPHHVPQHSAHLSVHDLQRGYQLQAQQCPHCTAHRIQFCRDQGCAAAKLVMHTTKLGAAVMLMSMSIHVD